MALDDEYMDPEPVCVKGIEEEAAVDRCHELGLYGGRANYWGYRAGWRKTTALFGAEAGVFLSSNSTMVVLLGIATVAAAAVADWSLNREHKKTVQLLAMQQESCYRKP